MSGRASGGEAAAKRGRTEGRGGAGGSRGGRGATQPAASTADVSASASSLAFVLPKDLLQNCLGRWVVVSLQNGQEINGLLEKFDEDCNLQLADVTHYLVEVVERDSAATSSGSAGFSFKTELSALDQPDQSQGSNNRSGMASTIVGGNVIKSIERTKVLRECKRIILPGANILGIAPNTQV